MKFAPCLKFTLLAAALVLSAAVNVSAQTPLEFKDGQAQAKGQLTPTDPQDPVSKYPCQIFTIELKASQDYQIDMTVTATSSSFPFPYLGLEDAAGKRLAEVRPWSKSGSRNLKVSFNCPADGKYRIIAALSPITAKPAGSFELSVQQVKVTQIALKDGIVEETSNITKNAPKLYAIKLSAGKTYQIDMMSKQIDSYLRLEDAAGKELAKDDDSGGNLNARIQFNCTQEGTYRIIATALAGGSGPFTLRVTEK